MTEEDLKTLENMARYSDDRPAHECDAVQAALEALYAAAHIIGMGPCKAICCWCGLELYGDADPVARMKAHQLECQKHPMRQVERERDELATTCKEVLRDVSRGYGLDYKKTVDLLSDGIARAKGQA